MLADPIAPDAATYEVNIVPMNFRTEYKERDGKFEEVHKVDLVKKGSNGESTPWTISALQKDRVLWPAVKPYYERWCEGQEDPVEGTPIDVLPFIPKGVVGHLRNLLIRSAEDLASVTDGDLERMGMGARGWREKARAWLENQKDGAAVAAAKAELEERNRQLEDEIAELREQVNALVADKPKRGRKKVEADDAEDAD